jgi:hypothetical protein
MANVSGQGVHRIASFLLLPIAFSLRAWGQSYSIDWYKNAGGGDTNRITITPPTGIFLFA